MYLGIVEMDKIKENEMKEKTMKEYKRRLRLMLKSKLNGKNIIKGDTHMSEGCKTKMRCYRTKGGGRLIILLHCL